MFKLPHPPPEIRLVAWPYPKVDHAAGTVEVEVEAYSADIMSGAKRVRHLRPPMIRLYKGEQYVIVHDDGEVIAVYRTLASKPPALERLFSWPFGGDDVSLT
jgi:hypothetical protein